MIACLLAALCAITVSYLIRVSAEPEDDEATRVRKLPYRQVMDAKNIACLTVIAVAMTALVTSHEPVNMWALVVWSSAGLALVWVDARTTWIPLIPTYVTMSAVLVATGIDSFCADDWVRLAYAALGGVAGWILFAAIWFVSGQLGFADVRLAGMIGMISGIAGFQAWTTTFLAGTLASAIIGLGVSALRRYRPSELGRAFAYGPGLWCGPYAWLILSS